MWTLLAHCPDSELDGVMAAFASGELVPRGQPLDGFGDCDEFAWDWRLPFCRAEHVEGVFVAERNGLRVPLYSITIVDRCASMIWLNRLSGPRIGYRRVEYRANGASPLKLSAGEALAKLAHEGKNPGRGGIPWKAFEREFATLTGQAYHPRHLRRLMKKA